MASGRTRANERAFLARAAWRVAIDRRRAVKPQESGSDPDAAQTVESHHPGPEQAMVDANQHAVIHAMIDALPEELRYPLVLSANDQLNSREIALILGIPEGTVRTRLQRARQLLRERLGRLNNRSQSRNQETQHAG